MESTATKKSDLQLLHTAARSRVLAVITHVVLTLLGVVIVGCGAAGTNRDSGGTGAPVINSLTASPSTISIGTLSILAWSASGATSVSIEPGGYSSATATGTIAVTPVATTTYTLTAANSVGSASATTTVTVKGGNLPVITSFTANPSTVPSGASTTLSWNASGTSSILINPGNFTSTAASGSTVVGPGSTTAYSLTAIGSGGSVLQITTVTVIATQTASACGAMSTGVGANFNGFRPFPPTNLWNEDISTTPVDSNSSSIINYIGAGTPLHPDFGTSFGIPYVVVDSSTMPLVTVALADSSESDLMPMPFPASAPIEGGSDAHVLVADRNTCWLYEVWEGSFSNGQWRANNSAVWDLQDYENRPYTWTSADAAGLPILPGLLRYEEVSAGAISHALRFTVPNTWAAFVSPATHWAQTNGGSPIPMGMRLRLKASFDISGFSVTNQVILSAMKKYGLILADNGSGIYVTGAIDSRWNDNDLHNLTRVTGSDFEVVQIPVEINANNVPTGPVPTISSFTASSTVVSAGSVVTLSWIVNNSSYAYINPSVGTQVGAVRGNSVIVTPAATTTYTLAATNGYGRATAPITINVH